MNRHETLFFLMFLSLSSPNWLFPKDTAPTVAPCEGSWFLFHISWTSGPTIGQVSSLLLVAAFKPPSSIKTSSTEILNIGLYHLPPSFWQPFTDSSVTFPPGSLSLSPTSCLLCSWWFQYPYRWIFQFTGLSAPWPPLLQTSHTPSYLSHSLARMYHMTLSLPRSLSPPLP